MTHQWMYNKIPVRVRPLTEFHFCDIIFSEKNFQFFNNKLSFGTFLINRKKQFDDAFSQTEFLMKSWCISVKSPFIFSSCITPCILNFMFWWILQAHTFCVPLLLAKMHSKGLNYLNFRREISVLGNFSLNCLCKSLRLKSSNIFCSCVRFPFLTINM